MAVAVVTVVMADSDLEWAQAVGQALSPYLVSVRFATSQRKVREFSRDRSVKLVVLNTTLMSIREIEKNIGRKRRPLLIVKSDSRDFDVAVGALRGGAVDLLTLGVSPSDTARRIAIALEEYVASPHYLSRRIDRYVKEHCADVCLSLELLSKEFRVSKGYISRLLREGYWQGFRSRLSHHRIVKAKRVIGATDLPMYLIAEECGFSSPSRFSETFGRVVGVPPKRYRASLTR